MAKFFIPLLLILVICAASVNSATVYSYIDCGSTSTQFYTDSDLNVWSGDGDFIQSGETKSVQSSNTITNPVMNTLRVFTTRKKNCYEFSGDKGGLILVRASFYYGNYDQKSSPPTFDLQFDGNYWTTVVTSNDEVVTYEATYVAKGDDISVCVAQTNPNQFPFISALVLRSLDSNMYSTLDPNYALLLNARVAYGAADVISSSDSYGRIWTPAVVGNGLINVTSNALPFVISLADSPPLAVLQNAVTTASTSDNLILVSGFPSNVVSVFLNMYFSEPTQVTEKRSFNFYIDDESSSKSIVPPYDDVQEISRGNLDVTSNTAFSLVATSDSVLPPLINAMELFYLSNDKLTDGMNIDDLETLALLQTTFADLQSWSGDPCLPASFTWDWLECSTDTTPRITALHLGGFQLSGSLPDLSPMTSLQTIDMHNNSLTGVIPDTLGNLPNLQELNLAGNQLSGSVPTSLSKNTKLKLDVTGNPKLCTGKSCDTTSAPSGNTRGIPAFTSSPSGGVKTKNSKLPVILGTTIPSGFLVSAFASFYARLRYKRNTINVASKPHPASGGGHTGTTPLTRFGEELMNEIRVNVEDQIISDVSGQVIQEVQNYMGNPNS